MKLLIFLIITVVTLTNAVGTDVFTVCGEAPSRDGVAAIKYYGEVFGVPLYADKTWTLDKFKHIMGVLA